MSAEFRHIFFNDGELVAILASHRKKSFGRLPSGAILDLKVDLDPELTLSGRMVPDDGADEETISLRGRDLESAIISYCINQRIPLPAKGVKRIEILNNRLALIITINVKGGRVDGT
ncbi:MAG: hypothetical protein R3245_05230 [Kiloniellales bacterium]|nr:hypothetical protein [Kiloniellales bacterium]